MDKREFFDKVTEMRKHQKEFFSAKPGTQERARALSASKLLENDIDREIARVQELLARKETYLTFQPTADGGTLVEMHEGFDMAAQYKAGMTVFNITRCAVTYDGRQWEAIGGITRNGGKP